jgi:hypothetical protein
VVEVGNSETLHQLVLDAHVWLESADSHVRQVILIEFTPGQPRLIFQKWEHFTQTLRSTRSDQPRGAQKTQAVEVRLVDNVPTANGSLELSFAKIFERSPEPNTKEGDFVFTPADVTHIARLVWRRQNLIPPEMEC